MISSDFSSFDTIRQLNHAETEEQLWDIMLAAMKSFGFDYTAYAVTCLTHEHETALSETSSVFRTNLPTAFLKEFNESIAFILKDWTFIRAIKDKNEILWHESAKIKSTAPYAQEIDTIALKHGFGYGVTIPFHFAGGTGIGAVALTSKHFKKSGFEKNWCTYQSQIQACVAAFDTVMRDKFIPKKFALSGREKDCLRYLLQGKRAQQIAYILGTSSKTVEKQIVSARKKLQVDTVPQAVAKAVIYELLTE